MSSPRSLDPETPACLECVWSTWHLHWPVSVWTCTSGMGMEIGIENRNGQEVRSYIAGHNHGGRQKGRPLDN